MKEPDYFDFLTHMSVDNSEVKLRLIFMQKGVIIFLIFWWVLIFCIIII